MKTRSGRSPIRAERIPSPLRPLVVLIAAAFSPIGTSLALPTGEQVVAGSAAVSRPSAQSMMVQQSSPRAIINWQSFSIAAPESVNFRQPSVSSVMLNRVIGTPASEIAGRMSANGQVFLVNPNGVLFTSTAVVDVGGLVASTLDISNQDFMAGRYRFSGSGGSVTNAGSLRASDGGTVALLGGQVQNDGTITAKLGTVALAAGNRVTLDFAGDGLTKVSVSEGALGAAIQNRGAVIADGGQVILTAHAASSLTTSVVNQSGIVRAQSLMERNGQIVLDAGEDGTTMVTANVDASGRVEGTKGGEIRVLGGAVELGGTAQLDASGEHGGGKILIGGDYQGKNPEVLNSRSTTIGADVTIAADALREGDGGRVIVWSDGTTAFRGSIAAKGGPAGGHGGFVETSGSKLDITGARVSAGAAQGAPGTWLLDPLDITIGATEASSISTSLAENSVTVTTDGPPPASSVPLPGTVGNGDITVNSAIEKTTGPEVTTLQLFADQNIAINAPIASTAGPLNVEMVSRKEAIVTSEGRVSVSSVISTNGGRVVITGGKDGQDTIGATNVADIRGSATTTQGTGVLLSSARINAGGGDVLIRGGGAFTPAIDIQNSSILGRNVQLTGAGAFGGDGVHLSQWTIASTSESRIEGTGGDSQEGFSSAAQAGGGIRIDNAVPNDGTTQPTVPPGGTFRLIGTGGSITPVDGGPGYGGNGGPGIAVDGVPLGITEDQFFAIGTGGNGLRGLPGGAGVTITNSTVQMVNAGDILIQGGGGGTPDGPTGAPGSPGVAGASSVGILVQNASISGPHGELSLLAGTSRVSVASSTLDGGSISLRGNASTAGFGVSGVEIQASTLTARTGNIGVDGTGGSGQPGFEGSGGIDGSPPPPPGGIPGDPGGSGGAGGLGEAGGPGVSVLSSALRAPAGGITINGTGGAGGAGGVGGLGGTGASGSNDPDASFLGGSPGGSGGQGGVGSAGGSGVSVAANSTIEASGAVTLTGTGGAGGRGGAGGQGGTGGAGIQTGDGGAGGAGGIGGNGGSSGSGVDLVASSVSTAAGRITIVGTSATAGGGGAGGGGGPGGVPDSDSESTAGADGVPGRGGAGGFGGQGFYVSTSSLQTQSGNVTITGTGGGGGAGASAADGDGSDGGAGGAGVLLSSSSAVAGAAIRTSSGFIEIVSFGGNGGLGGNGAFNSGSGGNGGAGLDTGGTIEAIESGSASTQISGKGGTGGTGGSCGGLGSVCGTGGSGGTGVGMNTINAPELIQASSGGVTIAGIGGDGAKGGDGAAGSTGGFAGSGGSGIAVVQGASIIGTTGSITLAGTGAVGGPGSLIDGAARVNSEGFSGGGVNLFGSVADNPTIRTTSGAIFITGLASSPFANRGATGLTLSGVVIETTAGGGIDIRGRGEAPATAFSTGVRMDSPSTIRTQGTPGTIVISGESTGADWGVVFSQSEAGGIILIGGPNTSGNIVIRASNAGGGDSIELGGTATTIQTTGVINLRPGGVSATGALTPADGETIEVDVEPSEPVGTFRLSPSDLDTLADGATAIVIGGSTHTGPISVLTPYTFKDNVTLQNAAEGSLGIAINAALSSPGNMITLSSAGPVTQEAPITAAALLLDGTGPGSNFALASAPNVVARFDADSPKGGEVQFANGSVLSIEQLSGTGIDTTTNAPTTIAAPNSVSFEDLVVSAAGNLSLGHNISTVGSNIDLVTTGVFNNFGNGTITPGGTGSFRVWANTWVGETRGGLMGTSPYPNFYGCTYPGTCTSGVTIPVTGNRFIYQGRPTLTFSTLDLQLQRLYYDPNPTFPEGSLSGVLTQLGDTQADAITGTFSTPATITSSVGQYPIVGTFASPTGYIISPPTTRVGTLTITPAILTYFAYIANPVRREYGLDNPPFTGTVTGFRGTDTLENATIGALTFTSPATPASPVGTYPIWGSGLTARNYVFGQAPSNATALSVTPAPLTYVANPVTREYGVPNPALTGTVAGIRNADSIASATTGALAFTTPANPVSNPGVYPVVGSGITPNGNYQFSPPEQAPSNATALRVTPQQTGYELVSDIPTFDRTPGFNDTNVYASGFLLPSMCIATEPMVSWSGVAATGDILELEWARVRVRPKLTNCVSIGDRDYCRDF